MNISVESLAFNAKIKGIRTLGTGDCLHPKWLSQLREKLVATDGSTYEYGGVRFIVTGEVNCVYKDNDFRIRRMHCLLILPDLDAASALASKLSRKADLSSDGRPTIGVSAQELVDEVYALGEDCELVPAHIWTPWFSVLGARNGFNSLKECFGDRIGKIHAVETGLSSDPPMNWTVSSLDRYTLLSNSDSHSDHPWRLGRESNLLSQECDTYRSVLQAVRTGSKLLLTLEVPPAFGKYHWTGHRKCGVSMSAEEAVRANDLCPVCHKKMTLGVEERVLLLSDRPKGIRPANKPRFVYTLPLHELLVNAYRTSSYTDPRITDLYNALVKKYGNEYKALYFSPIEHLKRVNPLLASWVAGIRAGDIDVIPGYDGVYGSLRLVPETLSGPEKMRNR
ncbi:MAG: endonuclease Q family protein [Thermoprotei archaeon]